MNEESNALWRGFEARLERLEDMVRDLDEVLRGDRHKKIFGLLPEYDRLDLEVRKLNAVVFVDSTGKRGIAHDVDYLMDRRSGQERREGFKWTFWGLILATIISSLAAVLTNLDKIKILLPVLRLSPLEEKIERARHPKGKKVFRVRIAPQEKAPSEDIKEIPPN